MEWKKKLSRLSGRMTKENWIVLLCLGLIIMIIAMPLSGKTENGKGNLLETGTRKEKMPDSAEEMLSPEESGLSRFQEGQSSYEAVLEERVKEVLKKVEGVGAVDVLIVLKSSEEKIYRTDGKTSQSSTKEMDAAGGSREISEQQEEYSSVLGGNGSAPLLEKELRPEISGIVISAQGGGSPAIKAEITEAMEALFGLPAHKIKVLKRVE